MEKIICAAIKYEDNIFLGKRHCDCFGAVDDEKYKHQREIQGFMTSKNRFVNRREARIIAVKAEQLIERASEGNILYSEDIY